MTQNAIEQFLWEELGYRKIKELMEGRKDRRVGIRDFLEGTLFATFKPFTWSGINQVRVTMPAVPRIHTIDEFKLSGGYPIGFQQDLLGTVLNYPFFTQSMGFLHQRPHQRRNEMVEYLQNLGRRLFPNAEVSFRKSRGILTTGIILDEDFYFSLVFPSHTTAFDTYFKVNPDMVTDINRIVSRYHFLSNRKRTDYGPSQIYTQIPELDLVSMIGTKPDDELLATVSSVENLRYSPESSYRTGQVINHNRWGPGIIQETHENHFTVYFPALGVTKNLIHNYKS
ncbi:MAG: hypothetical protein HYT70_04060 [Candidatus Aenigmarchaeota archaeon]|nr:hypothetical protein [Candidatus Aenigmarchaeota archaeon]